MRTRMDTLIRSVHHIEMYLQKYVESVDLSAKTCKDCICGRMSSEQEAPKTVLPQGDWLDRQGVMDYLKISYRTYYRLKANGTLKPHRFGGRDYYFIFQLEQAKNESIRRGRL